MKLALRARSPATDDRTTRRPWPWWRRRAATASMAEASPREVGRHHRSGRRRVELVGTLVAEHAGGHQHQIDVAEAVEDVLGEGTWPVGVERVEGHRLGHVGPGGLGPVHGLGQPGPSRPASTTVRHRPGTSLSTMAWAISEEPPSTSTDWGRPMASIMVLSVLVVGGAVATPRVGAGSWWPRSSGSLGWCRPEPWSCAATASWPVPWSVALALVAGALVALGLGASAWPGRGSARVSGWQGSLAGGSPTDVGAQPETPAEVGSQHPVGVDPVPDRPPLIDPGVHGRGSWPVRPGSPWPGRPGPRLPPPARPGRRAAGRARDGRRDVEGQGPAGHGKGERARVARAERLSTARKLASLQPREPLDDGADRLPGAVGHHELVLQEALRAVDPVPVGHPVQRVEEVVMCWSLPHLAAGGLAKPELVEGADGQRLEQPPSGRRVARAGSGARSARPCPGPARWPGVLQPGVVAAGEHRASERRPWRAVDPGHRVAVGRRSRSSLRASRCRGRWRARCRPA